MAEESESGSDAESIVECDAEPAAPPQSRPGASAQGLGRPANVGDSEWVVYRVVRCCYDTPRPLQIFSAVPPAFVKQKLVASAGLDSAQLAALQRLDRAAAVSLLSSEGHRARSPSNDNSLPAQRPGDSLLGIALKFRTDVPTLLRANRLTTPASFNVCTTLLVPASGADSTHLLVEQAPQEEVRRLL